MDWAISPISGGRVVSAVTSEAVNSALTVRSVESSLACVGDLPPALFGLLQFNPSYQVELARESGQVNRWSELLKAGAVGPFVKVLEDFSNVFKLRSQTSNVSELRSQTSKVRCYT